MGTVYTSAVSTIPSPLAQGFIPWTSGLLAYRLAECPVARSTTYYAAYSAAGDGSGGSGAGTEADPYLCATVDHIDALYSTVASGGDVALLINKGDEFESTSSGITMDIADTTIGSYGTGDNPILWAPSNVYTTGWTLESGNTYERSEASDVQRILYSNDIFDRQLAHQTSLADCQATDDSFYYDSGTTTLYVNLGGDNPNSTTLRGVIANNIDGVEMTADGTRVDGLAAYGHGVLAPAAAVNQVYAIKGATTGTNACVVSNCEGYFNNSHNISHFHTSSGGIFTAYNCRAGFCTANYGTSCFNFFSTSGGSEGFFDSCTCVGGKMPTGTAAHVKEGVAGFGHAGGGGATQSLLIFKGTTTLDSTYGCNRRTTATGADMPAAPTSGPITASRCFIINDVATVPVGRFQSESIVYIGGRVTFAPTETIAAGAFQGANAQGGWVLNSIVEVDLTNYPGTFVLGLYNPTTTDNDWVGLHMRIHVTGQSTTNFRIDRDGAALSDGVKLKNSIITSEGFGGSKGFNINLGNNLVNAGNINANAYFQIDGSEDTTTDLGYGNDANAVELDASPSLLAPATGDLLGAGEDVGLKYDYYGRPRTASDIGPVVTATGGGLLRRGVGPSIRSAIKSPFGVKL